MFSVVMATGPAVAHLYLLYSTNMKTYVTAFGIILCFQIFPTFIDCICKLQFQQGLRCFYLQSFAYTLAVNVCEWNLWLLRVKPFSRVHCFPTITIHQVYEVHCRTNCNGANKKAERVGASSDQEKVCKNEVLFLVPKLWTAFLFLYLLGKFFNVLFQGEIFAFCFHEVYGDERWHCFYYI